MQSVCADTFYALTQKFFAHYFLVSNGTIGLQACIGQRQRIVHTQTMNGPANYAEFMKHYDSASVIVIGSKDC